MGKTEIKENADITFVNYQDADCGCKVEYSDGYGSYADVIFVKLCDKHKKGLK
ncbi:hypothetical protein LCGC14_0862510 [marine sediment metagenome]|uniref:Uncharacterized protein n=1 Tax=marine sediment metagenome TaxID=412755 RepID=A0A0F9PSH3_9ZZZZ